MKISVEWLGEYVDVSAFSVQDLSDRITLSGIEVDDIHTPGERVTKLVVGEVLAVDAMEGSDHLHVTQVSVGAQDTLQIVCGAPNVAQGQKVIVALPGAQLKGTEIKKGSIRGTMSEGMICSLQEIGFDESVVPKKIADGIYVFPADTPVGASVHDLLGLHDGILELDLTPNRADALSMRGMAYETGAILDQTPVFVSPKLEEEPTASIQDYVSVSTESDVDCAVYMMRVVKDVAITESPVWLQKKLMHAGIRPVDLVVDTTNYVMLEYGQPLHGFDYDTFASKQMHVRRARENETMDTLDGTTRTLSPGHLLVTNGDTPVAVAGVMGGLDTHITSKTKTVALEAAIFSPELVRQAAKELNLRSESSSRFEKGVNWSTVQDALDHAASLIAELGGGTVVSGVASSTTLVTENSELSIGLDKINRSLGTALTVSEVEHIFTRLQFPVRVSNERFTVQIPPRRWDLFIEADLLEEVARIYGYHNIAATLPITEGTPALLSDKLRYTRHTERFLEGCGLSQTISYALTTVSESKRFSLLEAAHVDVNWPLSTEHQTLRMNVVAGLLKHVAYNQARSKDRVAFYEIGRVFYGQSEEKLPKETNHLAAVLAGPYSQDSWQGKGQITDFYTLKGIVEGLLDTFELREPVQFVKETQMSAMHPGRIALVQHKGETIGFIGQVHPMVAKEYDISDVYVCELDLDALVEAEKEETIYSPIPRYPGMSRDVAFMVEEGVTHAEIVSVIEAHGGPWLRQVHVFDIYTGDSIEAGKKSVAYSLSFLNPAATLVEEPVQEAFEAVKAALETELGASIR